MGGMGVGLLTFKLERGGEGEPRVGRGVAPYPPQEHGNQEVGGGACFLTLVLSPSPLWCRLPQVLELRGRSLLPTPSTGLPAFLDPRCRSLHRVHAAGD